MIVISLILKEQGNDICIKEFDRLCTYTLLNGQVIHFPYRIYYNDNYEFVLSSLTFEQRMIYRCIFSRSCDGYVREKHIKYILAEKYPDWVIPYILKVCDEYVEEILEDVYYSLMNSDIKAIRAFCQLNMQTFLKSHNRMMSYWNEYYRKDCNDYIGIKLFSDCFGYTKNMEKEKRIIK